MSDETTAPGGDEDGFLVAEYALGVLPAVEYAAVGARISAEPGLRVEYRFWRRRLAGLDAQFAETPAPASVWMRIERRLFAAGTVAAEPTGWWNSLALWRGLSGVAAAIAIVAIGVNLATPRPDPKAFAAQLVAAMSAQGSNVQVVALYNAQSGEVRLTTLSGDVVPGKDYELWAIEGANPPKSMGVIPINASSTKKVAPDLLAGFGPGTTLAISLEKAGGSTTGAPDVVVAAGKAAPI
jgi:anti-sigma-K factor RskA